MWQSELDAARLEAARKGALIALTLAVAVLAGACALVVEAPADGGLFVNASVLECDAYETQ